MTKKEYQLEIFKKLEKSQGHDYASFHFVSIWARITFDMERKYAANY